MWDMEMSQWFCHHHEDVQYTRLKNNTQLHLKIKKHAEETIIEHFMTTTVVYHYH